ncbi:MAG: protoheme IX farnesyltransferase [Nitrospirae bacterium]|nr:protoheme IX farnesyltransferase [Nitrospirota bacterium]MBF0533680.1 protoheme IX farnesyltransferase [Nitrospirota bacterium]MBF0616669.1 protoheme IX farnesyltransferase [Nitrospirota bacterium]
MTRYRTIVRDHVVLMKPGIVLLVLVTALNGMYMAQRGFPTFHLILPTMLGIGLSAAGSAVLNNFFDKDIDSLMKRTMVRAIPQGRIYPTSALIFGLVLIVTAITIFLIYINTLSAILTFISAFIYVIPYTVLMKRRTHLVTHVGSITGALPPVIGYVAVKGIVDIQAFVLFAIMFIWQHPHFWAYALKYKEDYSRAGIPILPISKGIMKTKTLTLIYTIILLPLSVLPYFLAMAGYIYLITSTVLGIIYIVFAVKFYFSESKSDKILFVYSIIYITIVFIVLVMDMIK